MKEYENLTLEKIEEMLSDIFKKGSVTGNKLPIGQIGDSGAYRISDNCITGIGGWEMFQKALVPTIQSKIFDLYLYTTTKGWMYMLDKNYFMEGDTVTDGENIYKIKMEPILPYVFNENGSPAYGGEPCWIYTFEERIDNPKNKILTKYERTCI